MNKKGITFTTSHRNAIIVVFGISLLFSISFYSCRNLNSNTTLDVPSPEEIHSLKKIDSSHTNFAGLRNKDLVCQFYHSQNFNVVWLRNNHLTTDADSLLDFIEYIRFFALSPRAYYKSELQQLRNFIPSETAKQQRVELLLTDAFFSLAHDLNYGLLPQDQISQINSDSVQLNLLNDALKKHAIISSLKSQQPKNKDYVSMQLYLEKVISETDSLTQQTLFNGIEDDTAVFTRQIRTVELNMHRWRRDRDLKGRYLLANIPEYYLRVYDDDSLILESKIIVGTEKDRTPKLSGAIKSFTLYPHWRVPRKIAVNELLPQIIRDSSYLSKHKFEVLDVSGRIIDPSAIDFSLYHQGNFPFVLRQKVGLANSMGVIKFTFQNPYAVYLHDTNARSLFNRDQRALSHGCIRLDKALELARYLLADDDLVTPQDLDQYLEIERQITIRVRVPLPIYVRYYTCSIKDGEVKFFDDVYGVDDQDQESLGENKKRDVSISL
jgi:L,D-transpeptidase YcbB